MLQKLVSKAQLSRIAGITAAAVTKAIRNDLRPALVGKRIDLNHPATVKYLTPPSLGPAPGVDVFYQQAIELCQETGRFTVSVIARHFGIGYARAERIFKMMQVAELDKPPPPPRIGVRKPAPPPPPKKELPPIDVGIATTKDTKKQHAMETLNNVDQTQQVHEVPEQIEAFADMTLRKIIERFGTDTAFVDWLKSIKEIEWIAEKRLKNAVSRGELVNRDLIKVGIFDPINSTHQQLLTDGAKSIAVRVHAMSQAGRSVAECDKYIKEQISSFIRPVKSKMVKLLRKL